MLVATVSPALNTRWCKGSAVLYISRSCSNTGFVCLEEHNWSKSKEICVTHCMLVKWSLGNAVQKSTVLIRILRIWIKYSAATSPSDSERLSGLLSRVPSHSSRSCLCCTRMRGGREEDRWPQSGDGGSGRPPVNRGPFWAILHL